jgi:hypothetical protein
MSDDFVFYLKQADAPSRTWEEKIFDREEKYKGKKIKVWGM